MSEEAYRSVFNNPGIERAFPNITKQKEKTTIVGEKHLLPDDLPSALSFLPQFSELLPRPSRPVSRASAALAQAGSDPPIMMSKAHPSSSGLRRARGLLDRAHLVSPCVSAPKRLHITLGSSHSCFESSCSSLSHNLSRSRWDRGT